MNSAAESCHLFGRLKWFELQSQSPRKLRQLVENELAKGVGNGAWHGIAVTPDFDGWAGFWPISRLEFAAKTMT